MFKSLVKYLVLFVVFGSVYFGIECIFKGCISDYRMAIMGGLLAVSIGLLNNLFSFDTDFIMQCLFGALLVTLAEAICGIYWTDNGIYIWDYSSLPFSACHGTVNLFFSCAWFLLSGLVILADDAIRYYIFSETRQPYYMINNTIILKMKEKQEK